MAPVTGAGVALVMLFAARAASAQAEIFSETTEYRTASSYATIAIEGNTALVGQPSPAPGKVHVLYPAQTSKGHHSSTMRRVPTAFASNTA